MWFDGLCSGMGWFPPFEDRSLLISLVIISPVDYPSYYLGKRTPQTVTSSVDDKPNQQQLIMFMSEL